MTDESLDEYKLISRLVHDELIKAFCSIVDGIAEKDEIENEVIKAAILSGLINFCARSLQFPFSFAGVDSEKIETVANGIFGIFKQEFEDAVKVAIKINNETNEPKSPS